MCDSVDLLDKEIEKKQIQQINNISERFVLKNKLLKDSLMKDYKRVISTSVKTIPSKIKLYSYQYVREERERYGKFYLYKDCGSRVVLLDCEKLAKNKEF